MSTRAIATVLSVAALINVASADAPAAASRNSEIKDSAGKTLGTLKLTAAPKGVILRVEAKGLTPGWHAAHFHEKGDCSDAAFKKSGSHVHSAAPVVHGLLNPNAADFGDLPNVYASKDGKVSVELYSSLVSLDTPAEGRPALLDADGSALIIHANADDHHSQPIGGAGDRVACAVIK